MLKGSEYRVGEFAKSDEQEAVMMLKGTIVTIRNPYWNGDRPETQYDLNIRLDRDICVMPCGSTDRFSGEVLEILKDGEK